VTCVYDEQPLAAAACAQSLGVQPFSELEPMWEHVDAVIACELGEARARIIGTALARGVDVLIEPPLAMTEPELQRMLSGIVRAPRRPVAMVGHDELYNPALTTLRELLQGTSIVSIEVERHDPSGPAALPASFDIVRDMLLPDLELVSALMGQPVAATQAAGAKSKPEEPFDHARALLVLEDNTLVSLNASHCGAARVRNVRVTTTSAFVTCNLDAGVVEAVKTLNLDDGGNLGSVVHRIDVPHRDPYDAQAEAFLDCIERRAKPRLNIGAVVAAEEAANAIRNRMALIDRRAPSRRTGKLRAA
jgi:predicted dehydrogenase